MYSLNQQRLQALLSHGKLSTNMNLTKIFLAVVLASTTISAIPIPKSSPAYCHGFGQPCMKAKRSTQKLSELLAWMWSIFLLTPPADSKLFTDLQSDRTTPTDSFEGMNTQSLTALHEFLVERTPDPRYCWRYGQPCVKKREETNDFTPESSQPILSSY